MEITLPLKLFIDLWLGHREFAVDNDELVSLLRKADPNSEIIHIESVANNLYHIYRADDWRKTTERRKKLEEVYEASRQLRFKREEQLERVIKGIQARMNLDYDMAKIMAKQFYKDKRTAAIELLTGEVVTDFIEDKEFFLKKI